MHHTTPPELSYWLRLSHVPGIGIARIKKMLTQFGSVEMTCRASRKALSAFQLKDEQITLLRHPNQSSIDYAVAWAQLPEHYIIPFNDARYPALLSEIVNGPAVLYVHGHYELLNAPQLAIVGSRSASYTGLDIATEFAFALAGAGLTITSGLAIGIDTASHRGALSAHGKTIAVQGCGLAHIYPKRNSSLAEQIVQNGCVISEFPLNAQPSAQHFPQRNRIISGLSLGTLVVEAAVHSGSLITAHYAVEQNRDVFAIPGSLRNATSLGCLSLIQQGAKCVTCVDDILNEISFESKNIPGSTVRNERSNRNVLLDSLERQVLACIEDLTTIDQICARCKLSPQCVTSILLQLELKDVIKTQPGGWASVTA